MKENSSSYLHNQNYLTLLVGSLFSKLSLGFYEVAIIWRITELTNSGASVALVIFVGSVVYIITAPFGGILADRISKKQLSVFGMSTDGIFTALAGVMFFLGNLDIVTMIVLLGLTNIATALREPAVSALVPLTLDKKDYQRGNATMGLVGTTSSLSSYALAGVLVAAFGVGWTLLLGSGLLFSAALSFSYLKEPTIAKDTQNESTVDVSTSEETSKRVRWLNWRLHLSENFGFLLQKPLILSLTLSATLINFLLAPLVVVLAPHSQALHLGAQGFGLMSAGATTGTLIGLITLNFAKVERPFLLFVCSTLLMGASLITLSFLNSILTIFIALMGVGLASSLIGIQIQVVLQKSVSAELMGRAYGVLSSLVTVAQPAGFALAGILLATQKPRALFLYMGFLIIASVLTWFRGSVRTALSSLE